jgi:xanthine/CO dehydrogenase XdhC/CoxF family maturation factor
MLMTKEGGMTGSISGGCLEGDVFEHAKKVMESGLPVVISYDTTSDDDLVWGLGLGCSGVVHVLIESLLESQGYLSFLEDCVRNERPAVLATVFRAEGTAATRVGSRLGLDEKGNTAGNIEDSELKAAVLQDLQKALRAGRTSVEEYRFAGSNAEVLLEAIRPPAPLVIFGAGHDAIPLARLAKELGWHITVADSRAAFTTRGRFPEADRIILTDAENVTKNVSIDSHAVVVLMTHNFAHDRNILRSLMKTHVQYLGVLGPKKRTEMLLEELRKEGFEPAEEWLGRLYSPVGIDIGAETPEEIALSILGEIQAVIAGRSGGLLRNRKGPIHDRRE